MSAATNGSWLSVSVDIFAIGEEIYNKLIYIK